ncbi:hypothetical protein LUZ60_008641 [Juncus effusus]|nr:hypothetical protein LUZ60_008641 [Juncus effusus]
MAEGFQFSSSLYLYNPFHSPKVLHLNPKQHPSPLKCSLSNPKPSPLLIHGNIDSHGIGTNNHILISGCNNTPSTNCAFDDDNDNAPFKFPNNTVGVIGGVSAASTLTFLQKLVELSSQHGAQPLPFLVCNNPALDAKASVVENLQQQRMFLERSGARCIAMPCQTLHVWHDEISKGSSVPFLHIGDCVAKELRRAKMKPVEAAGHNVRVGLVAHNCTHTIKQYQEILNSEGYEVVYLDKATVEHTVVPAVHSLKRKDGQGARQLLRIAIQVLLIKGVTVVILASDDICQILPKDDPLFDKYCINPIHSLARETVACMGMGYIPSI